MKQYLFLFLFITFAFLGSNKAYADNDNVEQELAMRVQQAQVSGNDSEFYDAHKLFLNHLEQKETWDKYYRVWMSRVIYDVNHKHFHRAYTPICVWDSSIAEEINQRWARHISVKHCRA